MAPLLGKNKGCMWPVLLLLALWPGGSALAGPNMAQDRKDFGVSEVEVPSVKPLDVAAGNAQVQQAAAQDESWTREAVLVALRFVGTEMRGHTKFIEVRTPPESRETALVTVTEAGYPDDAVAGARWRLWLAKDAHGVWTLQRALWAQLCSRSGQTSLQRRALPVSSRQRAGESEDNWSSLIPFPLAIFLPATNHMLPPPV